MFDLVSSNPMIQMADKGMTLASRRMTLIAGNLANIDTPNYQARDFSFEDAFKDAVSSLGGQNSPGFKSLPSYFPSSSSIGSGSGDAAGAAFERNDLNDVSLDHQNMLMAKTLNHYQLSSMFAQTELRRVIGAIRDAGK